MTRLLAIAALALAACIPYGQLAEQSAAPLCANPQSAYEHGYNKALEGRPSARGFYDKASTALRREIGKWLAAAKRPETRERRIESALVDLEARARRNVKSDFSRKRR